MSRFTRTCWNLSTLLCVLLVTLPFSSATQAQAVWSCTHGHSGDIEFEGRLVPASRTRAGWGLDFEQKKQTGKNPNENWIHFAPPSIHLTKSRWLALKIYTANSDTWVDKVHAYNLNDKVYISHDLHLWGPYKVYVFDMKKDIPFSALGISVRVKAGAKSTSHRFVFAGACALLDPTP